MRPTSILRTCTWRHPWRHRWSPPCWRYFFRVARDALMEITLDILPIKTAIFFPKAYFPLARHIPRFSWVSSSSSRGAHFVQSSDVTLEICDVTRCQADAFTCWNQQNESYPFLLVLWKMQMKVGILKKCIRNAGRLGFIEMDLLGQLTWNLAPNTAKIQSDGIKNSKC
jgi:hypothetical protein